MTADISDDETAGRHDLETLLAGIFEGRLNQLRTEALALIGFVVFILLKFV